MKFTSVSGTACQQTIAQIKLNTLLCLYRYFKEVPQRKAWQLINRKHPKERKMTMNILAGYDAKVLVDLELVIWTILVYK